LLRNICFGQNHYLIFFFFGPGNFIVAFFGTGPPILTSDGGLIDNFLWACLPHRHWPEINAIFIDIIGVFFKQLGHQIEICIVNLCIKNSGFVQQ
jgi:hypothetical protein